MIKNDFLIDGVPFAQYFNQNIKPYSALFPNFIDPVNFNAFMRNIEALTGQEEVSIEELACHIAIVYNETGGTFKPLREFGTPQYIFSQLTLSNGGLKVTYNRHPNRLAGTQMREKGVQMSEAEVNAWNGAFYPQNAPAAIQQASLECDFWRFRGWGFNQLTWRDAYIMHVQPHLPKPIDEYTGEQFEALLKDNISLACKAFHSYTYGSANGLRAMQEARKGNFAPYGRVVSGGWEWYVQNKYLPRATAIYAALSGKKSAIRNLEEYSIDELNLTPSQIKALQNEINKYFVLDSMKIVADGAWGPKTETAFKGLNMPIQTLLQKI